MFLKLGIKKKKTHLFSPICHCNYCTGQPERVQNVQQNGGEALDLPRAIPVESGNSDAIKQELSVLSA